MSDEIGRLCARSARVRGTTDIGRDITVVLSFRLQLSTMARASAAYLKALAIVSSLTAVILLVFFITPYLIEHNYPAAAPVAAAIVWVKETIEHALASFAFIGAVILLGVLVACDICACRATPPGLIALEAGTSTPTLTPHAAGEAAHQPAGAVVARLPVTTKLLLMASFIYFIIWQALRKGIVSPEQPFLENLGFTMKYILDGLPLVCDVYLVWGLAGLVRLYKQRRSRAAAAVQADLVTPPRVEVLFDDAASVEVKEEKA
ncbi:hypothetical protein C8R45DRAFT_123287 [Mycena sanguinolenta]|nr:hypothetical protein C8R45DRAFT_123287 [Mycena sanguinolenta]